jgi:hypothetical protein
VIGSTEKTGRRCASFLSMWLTQRSFFSNKKAAQRLEIVEYFHFKL